MNSVQMKQALKNAEDKMKVKNKDSRQYPGVLFNITFSMYFLTNYPVQGRNSDLADMNDMISIRNFAWRHRKEFFFNSVNGSIFLDFLFWGFHKFKRGFGLDSPDFMKMSAAFETMKERIVNPNPQYLQRTRNDHKFRKHILIGNELFYKYLFIYLYCFFQLNIDLYDYLKFITPSQTLTLENYKSSLFNSMMTKGKNCLYASCFFDEEYKAMLATITSGMKRIYIRHNKAHSKAVLIQFVLGICAEKTLSGKNNTSVLQKFPVDIFRLYVVPLYYEKQSYTEFYADPNIQNVYHELFQPH